MIISKISAETSPQNRFISIYILFSMKILVKSLLLLWFADYRIIAQTVDFTRIYLENTIKIDINRFSADLSAEILFIIT